MTFQAFYDAWVQHGNKLLSRAQSFPLHSTASHARWEKNLCLPISHVALAASTAKTPIGAHCLPPISAIGQLPVSGSHGTAISRLEDVASHGQESTPLSRYCADVFASCAVGPVHTEIVSSRAGDFSSWEQKSIHLITPKKLVKFPISARQKNAATQCGDEGSVPRVYPPVHGLAPLATSIPRLDRHSAWTVPARKRKAARAVWQSNVHR